MFWTKCISSLKPLNACRLDIESEKITKLFSLLRRMRANASEIAYSSATNQTRYTECSSSLFDPLRFVSPFVLPAERLLQELCRKNIGWDDRISEPELRSWQARCDENVKLQNIGIDRCVKPCDFECPLTLQLHHFCDASQDGYGTASYVQSVDVQGRVGCRLLIAKCRLAPMKPRLELQEATLAVKMDKLICGELNVVLQQSVCLSPPTTKVRATKRKGQKTAYHVTGQVHTDYLREVNENCEKKASGG